MASTYKLLALDLDGTLTDDKKQVSETNKWYISKAQDAGVKIVLASGRPVIGIKSVAEALGLYQRGGYILAYNGGHIIDCATNEDIIKRTISMDLFHDICEINKFFDVFALSYNDFGVICENDSSEYVKKEGYNNSIPVIKVESLEKELKEPVVKFMVVGKPTELKKAYVHLCGIYDGILNIFFSEPYFMEITPLGIEKASALEKLGNELSVNRDEIIACGDGLNDIPMLEYAGFSVAMDNAYKEVKECADAVVSSNLDDGVAEAIKKFILQEDW